MVNITGEDASMGYEERTLNYTTAIILPLCWRHGIVGEL
jgi:hypothetical protein